MAYMVAQDHEGIYDAIRSGTSRTSATIAAAIATIGSAVMTLVLTKAGDGVWTITSNLTIPSNITLQVPPGVTVFRNSGVTLTIQGVVVAWSSTWDTGPGTTVRSPSALREQSGVFARNVSVLATAAGEGLFVSNAQGTGPYKRVRIYTDNGAGGVGIQMSQLDNNNSWNWQMSANTGGGISWNLAGAVVIMHLLPTGLGLGPNNTPSPSYYLQLNGDFAAKPNGGSWTNPVSSRAFKDIHGDFTDGLDVLKKLQPVRFHYDGQCGMPTDQEFIGLVAEDVQEAAPYMIRPSFMRLRDDDTHHTEVMGMNDSELRFILRNAILELDTRIKVLEGKKE